MSLSELLWGQAGFAVAYLLAFGTLVIGDNILVLRLRLARNCFLGAYAISVGMTMAWGATTRAGGRVRDVLVFALVGAVGVAAVETYLYFQGHLPPPPPEHGRVNPPSNPPPNPRSANQPPIPVGKAPPQNVATIPDVRPRPKPHKPEELHPGTLTAQQHPQADVGKKVVRAPFVSPPANTTNDLAAATYSWPPPGIVSVVTPFNGFASDALKKRIRSMASKLMTFESDYKQKIHAIAGEQTAEATDTSLTRKQLQDAQDEEIQEFQKGFLPEVRDLQNEVLTRLKWPYPTSSNSGLSVDGYRALTSGELFGQAPLGNLADYLDKISEELPE